MSFKSVIATLTVLANSFCLLAGEGVDLSRVDTRIGTEPGRSYISSKFNENAGESQGKTIPCVTEPHGMTSWTPQTLISERKGAQPYNYRDRLFKGFRASHWLVGGATQDYGSFYVMPAEDVALDHGLETASPDHYEMGGYELTARSHSAIMRMPGSRFTIGVINEYGEGSVCIDTLAHEISGTNPVHRIYAGKGLAAGFEGCFVLRYQAEPVQCICSEDGRSITLIFSESEEPVLMKAGCSFTGIDAARRNLEAEIPHWSFEQTRRELADIWQAQLGKIEVETGDSDLLEQFYSSLWRASLLPRVASDVDGSYPGFAGSGIMKQEGSAYYQDFSMWDTFRALHPLLNIISPSVNAQMMQSLVLKAQQGGWMPIFPCWGSYTSAMVGFHTVSVICDAWVKGVRGFDRREAYRQMRRLAFGHPSEDEYADGKGIRALESYEKYGYIPLEDEVEHAFHKREQASRTLEYAYDDYVLSRVALRTLHLRDYFRLRRRSHNWRNVFDPRTGYVQGRHEDGSFMDEDNLHAKARFITEGTPMHYSWFVPHDVKGLQDVMAAAGGDFETRLDEVFEHWYYWHGNEPCHHVAYLYDYTDSPYKLQKLVREILVSEYHNGPAGLSGNDDAGQMAAWFVFSSMGFYPVCPGGPARRDYAIGSPCFDKVVIKLENGRQFTILAEGSSEQNCYIGEKRLNGRRHKSNFLSYKDIMKGGVLECRMCSEPAAAR